jgi:hypothetical protein
VAPTSEMSMDLKVVVIPVMEVRKEIKSDYYIHLL